MFSYQFHYITACPENAIVSLTTHKCECPSELPVLNDDGTACVGNDLGFCTVKPRNSGILPKSEFFHYCKVFHYFEG